MGTGLTKKDLLEAFAKDSFVPTKSLGQNFLIDANIARKIASVAAQQCSTHVIEIGPGAGSLTVHLAREFEAVTAIEADQRLAAILEKTFLARAISNVRVLTKDVMEMRWQEEIDPSAPSVVAANLPYNISSQVLVNLLDEVPGAHRLVVMLQSEMVDRILAPIGTRECSSLSVRIALNGKARLLARVGPQVFYPAPAVGSAIVMIDRDDDALARTDRALYYATMRVVRQGFNYRRQMLRRSLGEVGGSELCEASGVDPSARAESLSLTEWIALGASFLASRELGEVGLDD